MKKNYVGVFLLIRYTYYMQVFTRSGRRTHINVPQSCWSEMGTVFQDLVKEMPLPSDREEGSGGSVSED